MSAAESNPEGSSANESPLARARWRLCTTKYLRRLDEMAARVAPAHLLREATTRDDVSNQLITGTDGFPLCFDVADNDTGSTFEVRSARYDEPVETLVRVGALNVELKAGCWESMTVDCRFDGPPVPGRRGGAGVAVARIRRDGNASAPSLRGVRPIPGRAGSTPSSVHVAGSS